MRASRDPFGVPARSISHLWLSVRMLQLKRTNGCLGEMWKTLELQSDRPVGFNSHVRALRWSGKYRKSILVQIGIDKSTSQEQDL